VNTDLIFKRLSNSKFRSSFHLKDKDKAYVKEKGFETIKKHAHDFIKMRLAPYPTKNDGHQTPTKGHPVFIAEHATATCCRGCLYKWYKIDKNHELTKEEQEFIVNIIMEWIKREL
jgi:exodeoxyribonuclease V alpha subunit